MICVLQGDITKVDDVDAIVNAANHTLLGGNGVDGAIHKAAGIKLYFACMKLRGCKTGEAKITPAYNLPCKYVIHTVGPVWHGGQKGESNLLKACYRNSMLLAKQYGIRRIAFPSISTGAFRYPVREAAAIAVETVKQVIDEHKEAFDLIEWVIFSQENFEIYNAQIL